MRKLKIFESVTLNGYFAGPGGDLSWAYANSGDPEFHQFVQGNAGAAGVLLFGRVTYEMMASYWPTEQASEMDPVVAKGMNDAEKIVFSRTLKKADWRNTTVVKGDVAKTVKTLKQGSGQDLIVLGSGTLVTELVMAGLVDEIQLVVKPVALGAGKALFEGIERDLPLRLSGSRTFRDGNVVLSYVRGA
jgi:dihydrofolate reductase